MTMVARYCCWLEAWLLEGLDATQLRVCLCVSLSAAKKPGAIQVVSLTDNAAASAAQQATVARAAAAAAAALAAQHAAPAAAAAAVSGGAAGRERSAEPSDSAGGGPAKSYEFATKVGGGWHAVAFTS